MTLADTAILILAFGAAFIPRAAVAARSCTVGMATGQTEIDEIRWSGAQAQVENQMLGELKKIAEIAKNAHEPIGDQLSPRDAARFATITSRLAVMRESELVESAYARDASVVEKMWETAWSTYANPSSLPAKNDLSDSLTLLLRLMFPSPKYTLRPILPGHCSVDDALVRAEDTAVRRMNGFVPVLERDQATMDALRAKYGVSQGEPLDKSKMTPEDIHIVDRIMVELTPGFQERTLAVDLQNIRDWWAMASLVHKTRLEDIQTYGGDPRYLGKTMQPMLAKFDPRQRAMLGLWRKVNEKIKSEAEKEIEAIARVAHTVQPETMQSQRR